MVMNKEDNREINFKDQEHEAFYKKYLPECRCQDVYHKALVYCLGISGDTRRNVERVFDFKKRKCKTEVFRGRLDYQWQRKGGADGVQSFL